MPRALPVLLLLGACAALADEAPRTADGSEPHGTCLVLSGGGARGAAHVGVLRVVEELGVPIDCIAGTSMGAFVGGLYAAGYSAADIESVIDSVPWELVFSNASPRDDRVWRRKLDDEDFLIRYRLGVREGGIAVPRAALPMQRLRLVLRELLAPVMAVRAFDLLPVPFRAVATDIITGEKVVLARGDLTEAILASMAVPGVFAPVEIDGRLLVDGGVSDNLPVSVARELGAGRVVASDVQAPLYTAEQLNNPFTPLDQLSRFLIRVNTQASIDMLTNDDVYVQPSVGQYSSAAFDRMREILPFGEAAARDHVDALTALAAAADPARRLHRIAPFATAPVVDAVEVETNVRVSQRYIEGFLSQQEGEPLDTVRLSDDLQALWGTLRFDDVSWRLDERDDRSVLHVEAAGDPYELGFLRPGIRIQDNFEGGDQYALGVGYTWTDINEFGAEWKNELVVGTDPAFSSEFYQPLGYGGHWFVAPVLDYESVTRTLRDEHGNRLAELGVETYSGQLSAGRIFGNVAEVRLGVLRGRARADVEVGPPTPAESIEIGAFAYRIRYDTLDSLYFPRSGALAEIDVVDRRRWLGDDEQGTQLEADLTGAWSWGPHSLNLSLEWAQATGAGPESLFDLGGFLRLSGIAPGTLSGKYLRLARVLYFRRIAGRAIATPFNVPVYVGGSLENGNAWMAREDVTFGDTIWGGSLFFGMDTLVGPVYLAGGLAEEGNTSLYLFIGSTF